MGIKQDDFVKHSQWMQGPCGGCGLAQGLSRGQTIDDSQAGVCPGSGSGRSD